MTSGVRWSLALILVAGGLIRVLIALLPVVNPYDLQSFDILRAGLRHDPLHLYQLGRFPYPPLYVAWVPVAAALSRIPGLTFYLIIKAPPMAADLTLAAIAAWFMLRAGQSPRRQVAAAALIALGPCFIIISAYHGQFDSLAILPAVIAVIIWRPDRTLRTALLAGALLGVGGALKTVPLLMLLALLPTTRSWAERAALLAPAVAIPLVFLLPFVVADPSHTLLALRYTGLPGVGGLSLVAQPDLAAALLLSQAVSYSSLSLALFRVAGPVTAAAVLGLGALLSRRGVDALFAAVVIWLCVYAVAPNFFFQYLVWGLPFFIVAGHHGKVLVLQVVVLGPAILFELRPWPSALAYWIYLALMVATWLALTVTFVRAASRLVLPSSPPAGQLG
jgi:hypothetical protein